MDDKKTTLTLSELLNEQRQMQKEFLQNQREMFNQITSIQKDTIESLGKIISCSDNMCEKIDLLHEKLNNGIVGEIRDGIREGFKEISGIMNNAVTESRIYAEKERSWNEKIHDECKTSNANIGALKQDVAKLDTMINQSTWLCGLVLLFFLYCE